MSDFLSQEEINALLAANEELNNSEESSASGADEAPSTPKTASGEGHPSPLTAIEIDALGEVGNVSMATAATTLSTLLSKAVDITTPQVRVSTFQELAENFKTPYVALQIQFAGELAGTNVLVIGIREAAIIAKLMMMQEVTADFDATEINELELSAVSESMNQMIGSASTAISTMLGKFIDIAPPITTVGDGKDVDFSLLNKDEDIVQIVFRMTIEDLIDSEIMQIYSLESAKSIVKAMMGGFDTSPAEPEPSTAPSVQTPADSGAGQVNQTMQQQPMYDPSMQQQPMYDPAMQQQQMYQGQMPMQQGMYPGQMPMHQQGMYPMYDPYGAMSQKPQFATLGRPQRPNQPKNIELILDVPMEMSVVLGKAHRSVKQILSLGPGSIVELNKYAEEPLDIFVNGMLVGQGEVVVIEEKFGIRVNSIVSTKERAESLGGQK